MLTSDELTTLALEAVNHLRSNGIPTSVMRARATMRLRDTVANSGDGTNRLPLRDAVEAVDRALSILSANDLTNALVEKTYGAWTYRFPNGLTVEVTIDMDLVAHFKTFVYTGDNDKGTARGGLTSDQVVAQLHYFKSLESHIGMHP